jgi:hypothetical protein
MSKRVVGGGSSKNREAQTENMSLSIFKAIKLTTFLQLAVDYRVAF